MENMMQCLPTHRYFVCAVAAGVVAMTALAGCAQHVYLSGAPSPDPAKAPPINTHVARNPPTPSWPRLRQPLRRRSIGEWEGIASCSPSGTAQLKRDTGANRFALVLGKMSRRVAHACYVCMRRTGEPRSVIRVGLIEVRQHCVLVPVIGYPDQVVRQCGDKVRLVGAR